MVLLVVVSLFAVFVYAFTLGSDSQTLILSYLPRPRCCRLALFWLLYLYYPSPRDLSLPEEFRSSFISTLMASILAAPLYLWNWYIDYLWNYDSNSWVATIAYAFRIWAILAILPTLVLALLDVTSYVIARTLGDPTASTSHKSSFPTQPPPRFELKVAGADDTSPLPASPAVPVIPIEVSPPQDKELPSPSDISPPKFPAPARPRALGAGGAIGGGESTSGESSFALLDREESFEDAGAHIRRRVQGTTGADDDDDA
ncbi:hypothetical protein BC827DRAFT_75896 [Russula dissimulans]|nr:hypothetical protein BC827DRAFT_75896 [Russula dissimulans]